MWTMWEHFKLQHTSFSRSWWSLHTSLAISLMVPLGYEGTLCLRDGIDSSWTPDKQLHVIAPLKLQPLCELWPLGLVQNCSKIVFEDTDRSQNFCPDHENLQVILGLWEVSRKIAADVLFYGHQLKLLANVLSPPTAGLPVHQAQAFLGTGFTQPVNAYK